MLANDNDNHLYKKKKKRTVIFLISSFQITFEQKQKKKY